MHNTDNIAAFSATLVDLIGFFSSPQRVELLLREADVDLDRALFPLLVCLAARGPLSIARLSDEIGRDHTTISRQLSKLEELGLITRQGDGIDRRVRTITLTASGTTIAEAVGAARRRLLSEVLSDWSEAEVANLSRTNRRFVEALGSAARKRG